MEDKVELKLVVNKDDLFKAFDIFEKKVSLAGGNQELVEVADMITTLMADGVPDWTTVDLTNVCSETSVVKALEVVLMAHLFDYQGKTREDFEAWRKEAFN